MKVLCIKDSEWVCRFSRKITDGPKYGDVCLVTGVIRFDYGVYYYLDGYGRRYNSTQFVPISDIDETELIKERDSTDIEITINNN